MNNEMQKKRPSLFRVLLFAGSLTAMLCGVASQGIGGVILVMVFWIAWDLVYSSK